jgi:hypothetical protein
MAEIYVSKKNKEVKAEVLRREEKYKTVIIKYLSGEKEGTSVSITESTFKRWWKKDETSFADSIDMEQVNTPYPEPKEKKYIPKPESVIEYENNKKRRAGYNTDLPEFNDIVDKIGDKCSKINESSKYVAIKDSKTTLWRKSRCIDVYADNDMAEKLSSKGLISGPNKDKDRPFHFKFETSDDLEKFISVL